MAEQREGQLDQRNVGTAVCSPAALRGRLHVHKVQRNLPAHPQVKTHWATKPGKMKEKISSGVSKENRPAAVLAKSFISVSKQFRFPFLLTYSSQKLVEFFSNEQANLSPEKALPEISVSQYFSPQTPNKDNYSDFQGVKSVSGFSPRVAFTTVTDLNSKAEIEPGLCCKASLLKWDWSIPYWKKPY